MNMEGICETGPTVYRPYPRRLESLTICWFNYKDSTFYSVILRPWELVLPESNSRLPAWQPDVQPMSHRCAVVPTPPYFSGRLGERDQFLSPKRFSTCAHITNLLKHFSTQTTTAATQQALRKDSLKEKRLGSWGQTLLRLFEQSITNFRTRLTSRGYPNITWWTKSSPKLNWQKERTLLHKHRKRTKELYPLWHNFIHHCHVWKTF